MSVTHLNCCFFLSKATLEIDTLAPTHRQTGVKATKGWTTDWRRSQGGGELFQENVGSPSSLSALVRRLPAQTHQTELSVRSVRAGLHSVDISRILCWVPVHV